MTKYTENVLKKVNFKVQLELAKVNKELEEKQNKVENLNGKLAAIQKIIDESKPGCTLDELLDFHANQLDRINALLNPCSSQENGLSLKYQKITGEKL